jgi:hypothetical protein
MRTDRQTDRQTDRHTNMTKLVVAFRNFVNGPKDNSSENTISDGRPVQWLVNTNGTL